MRSIINLNPFNSFEISLIVTSVVWALLILFILGESEAPMRSGDGVIYNRMALNLINYQTISFSQDFPIEPTLARYPGYPIFLALIYLISKNSISAVPFVQYLLLGLTAIAVYRLVRKRINEFTAKTSAIFCITYFPFLLFCSFHLTEILTTFIFLMVLLGLEKLKQTPNKLFGYLIIGLILGALTMIRPTFSLIVFPIIIGLAFERKFYGSLAHFWQTLLIAIFILIGFSVFLSPWLIRNQLLSHQLLLGAGSSESIYWSVRQYKGTTNYDFTNGQWETVYSPKKEEIAAKVDDKIEQLQNLSLEEKKNPNSITKELLKAEMWENALGEELKQLTLGEFLANIPKRVFHLWGMIPPAEYYFTSFTINHRIPKLQVWILFLLSISGLLLKKRDLLKDWTLWILPLYITFVHLIFHVEARYSVPAHPFILTYSAVGLNGIFSLIKERFNN
ncbi:MAG: glycosyltransferase family 39 protein [Acidobacteriota bacterium]|nr:glycosyltransferase family 39 protein [Acidobacteriota bacterium]